MKTTYRTDAQETNEINLNVEEMEEVIAPGLTTNHNETLISDQIELSVEELEEVIAPSLTHNHNETLVSDTNQLISLFRILREDRDAVIHGYSDGKLQRLEHLGKHRFDATAQCERLHGIRLREQQSELIAADAESRVGSTQSFFQGSRGGA